MIKLDSMKKICSKVRYGPHNLAPRTRNAPETPRFGAPTRDRYRAGLAAGPMGASLADLVVTLKELAELGVGFVSLTKALDLTTPAGRAMAGLLAVFAEFEREILRERVRAGLDHARQLQISRTSVRRLLAPRKS